MRTYKELLCENCGKLFEVEAKRKTQKFCTKGCATSFRQKANDPDFMAINKEFYYYCLGLVITDGCISQQDNHVERLTFRNSNKQLMERLHPLISPNRKLYQNKPRKKEHEISYAIVSTNEKSIAVLKKHGVEHDKTYSVKYPNIPERHAHHFIRGVFDGDGSIFINVVKQKLKDGSIIRRPYKHVSFTTASIEFAEGLIAHLESFGYHPKLNEDSRGGKFYVKLYRKEEIVSFTKWIYKNSNYHMENKKQLLSDDIV